MPATKKQLEALKAYRENGNNAVTASQVLGKAPRTVQDLVRKALKWEAASQGQIDAVHNTGLDITGATHGWRKVKNPDGSADSVFWRAEKAQSVTSQDLGQAITEALASVVPSAPISGPSAILPGDLCNFVPLADLHVGGEYGDPKYLEVVYETLDRLLTSLPLARKAVLLDMGDLLDANDHHGLTPASGNECDVIRENHLKNTIDAMNIMRFAIDRLAETHDEVEVHMLRGNHDETAYIGVMVALYAFYKENPRINIIMTDDDFRVIPWGKCVIFPHHGDKAKWEDLKSVFSDQFPEAWAAGKFWRFIWTAHVHHDKQREMIGAVGEHFRTLAAPNRWAQLKGLFSRGGVQCITLHKEDGEVGRTKANLRPMLLEQKPKKEFTL